VAAKQILLGLYRIPYNYGPIQYTTAYLIADGDELVMIDTGLPKREGAMLGLIATLQREAADVKHILITHHHYDHTGNLARLAERTGATIHVHQLDAPIASGREPIEAPSKTGASAKVIGAVAARIMPERLPRCDVGPELRDGEELPFAGGIVAIHTPGHTAGHTSFLWKRHGGVMLVGDAAGHLGRLGPPLAAFTEDDAAMRKSVAKLASFTFETAVFGHGTPVKAGASQKFAQLADRLAR
jgi:glyoxylase-like metal-dependent hydrolase (beta-lactamase superfamily II)